MKITFLTPRPSLAGGIRVIAIHARNLQARGHEVRIAHPGPHWPALHGGVRNAWRQTRSLISRTFARTHFDGLEVERIVFPAGSPPAEDELPDGDVVVATWWETAEWVAQLPASKGAKAYFMQHHELFDYLPTERVRATYRLPLHIITISSWLQRVLKEEYGVLDSSLVSNGVDPRQFKAVPRRNGPPTVGMMYSAEAWKGSDLCLDAVERARDSVPDLRLLSFGGPPRTSRNWPAWAHYVCQPGQAQIADLYSQCHAWLFGSRVEGFGLPILEAMACGTPVIATPAGAAPELLAGGGGVLVGNEDVAGMASAISDVCSMPDGRWQQLSDKALATAQEHTWEGATTHFEAGLIQAVRKQRCRA